MKLMMNALNEQKMNACSIKLIKNACINKWMNR